MLQYAPKGCFRAAASLSSFASSSQTIKLPQLRAVQLPKHASTQARRLSTKRTPSSRIAPLQFSSRPTAESCLCSARGLTYSPLTLSRKIATAASSTQPSGTASLQGGQPLTWNRFLALRKTRRRINLVASIITAAGSTLAGIAYLSQTDFDQVGARVTGMDPFIILGLSTFGFMGIGWLLGPFAGGAVFNVMYRGVLPEIRAKETDLFRRIQRHRADPSNSSIQNPIPDYYGEKIGSVKDYRTWLRDQRAFKLKRDRGAQ